ncbi:MAG: hypothetical protein ACTSRS_04160 [Candidatus Helarchaeota archaeon]
MGMDLNKAILGISIWDMVVSVLLPHGFVEKTINGLDGCVVWNESNVWAAVGYKGDILIVAVGWGSETPPGNPFEGGVLAQSKTPADTSATESDLLGLMAAQATEFPGIPGFELFVAVLTLATFTGMVFLLKKKPFNTPY